MSEIEQIEGNWNSAALEPTPNPDGSITYIKREFTFPGNGAWSLVFTGYYDAAGTVKLFSGRGQGNYELKGPSESIPGAQKADFHFTHKFFTVDYPALLDMFTADGSPWTLGVERDISATGCPFAPSVTDGPTEYDILKLDGGNLYFGDRSLPLYSEANRPTKPIAFPVTRQA